jgi:hypothetical protein
MNADWLVRVLPSWEKNHPGVWAGVRVGAGIWLLILTAILYGYDRGGWWRVLLIAAAAGHFYFAHLLYRLPRATSARGVSTDAG